MQGPRGGNGMNSERKGEHPGRDAPGAPLQAAPHGEISLRLEAVSYTHLTLPTIYSV